MLGLHCCAGFSLVVVRGLLFVAVHGLLLWWLLTVVASPVVASHCGGLSLWWPLTVVASPVVATHCGGFSLW